MEKDNPGISNCLRETKIRESKTEQANEGSRPQISPIRQKDINRTEINLRPSAKSVDESVAS
jgi:hypothetical protein